MRMIGCIIKLAHKGVDLERIKKYGTMHHKAFIQFFQLLVASVCQLYCIHTYPNANKSISKNDKIIKLLFLLENPASFLYKVPMKNTPADTLDLLRRLCAIPSVTTTAAEAAVPQFLFAELSRWAYFAKHPDNIWLDPLSDDKLARHNFCAIVRAEPATSRAIILLSHHDVVPVDNCQHIPASPFDIAAYTEAIKHAELDPETINDVKAGEWLFGRGIADMKGGMAAQIALLAELAEQPETLQANILLITTADEENNGFGIHQAVRTLADMQAQGLAYIACIDSEPSITNVDKDLARIYTGTIGNATLFALAVGQASHVGEYFSGLNSTSLISQLVLEIEGDPDTADEWMGARYSPATCLYMRDLASSYSVTLPEKSVALFNILLTTFSPQWQMAYMCDKAKLAAGKALAMIHSRKQALKHDVSCMDGATVITYADLMDMLRVKHDVQAVQKAFLGSLPADMSEQERGIALVEHMAELAQLPKPYVVVGFLSYCQPRLNQRITAGEKRLLAAVEAVVSYAKVQHGQAVRHEEVFEGISDMSELGYQGSSEDLRLLKANFVGLGVEYAYPFAAMQRLDVPVVNLGPIGKDAHKATERLNMQFYLNVLPDLLKKLVAELSAAC
jgi:arginine utilization protein RocB